MLLPRGENEKAESFKVNIRTQDPTVIFDTCAQIGKIKLVKIDERHPIKSLAAAGLIPTTILCRTRQSIVSSLKELIYA